MKKNILISVLLIQAICLISGCGPKETMLMESVEEEKVVSERVEQPEPLALGKENAENEDAPKLIVEEKGNEPDYIYVHICGAVCNPGVYKLNEGSRVMEGIDAAGGFSEDACEEYINLAEVLCDAQQIVVPTNEQVQSGEIQHLRGSSEVAGNIGSALVNINTADAQMLCTLPGIGTKKAELIIAYREQNGGFQSVEELMNIEGIKEGLFEKVKDLITVK